jgi:hypothetical protein
MRLAEIVGRSVAKALTGQKAIDKQAGSHEAIQPT